MYELDRPAYLQLLLLVPLLWGLFAYVLHYRRKKQDALATPRILMILAPYKSTAALAWKTILYTLVIVLLTLALVNPRIGTQIEKIKVQGSDVVFALDVSLSMKAEDVAPDRLEKAKQIISRTIDRLGGDRVGIIAYADSAYPLLPITSDYSAAKMFLATADPSMVSSQGTSIGDAIALSWRYFDDPTVKNKLLVILSDGEDHREDLNAVDVAKASAEKGLRIYTVGIGTPEGGPIPLRENGVVTGYKKDIEGNVVVTKADPQMLSEIAQATSGDYMDGTSTEAVVDRITDLLGKGPKNDYGETEIVQYKDRYQWFAGAALLLLVLDTLLGFRRSRLLSRYNLFGEEKPLEED